MTLLSLQNNILNTANPNDFSNAHFKILQVENYRLCCMLKGDLKCTAKIPWYTSCKHLLPSESIKIVFLCILCLIFSLNVASILCQLLSSRKSGKTKGFGVVVTAINFADISCAVPLVILWDVDAAFKDDFI